MSLVRVALIASLLVIGSATGGLSECPCQANAREIETKSLTGKVAHVNPRGKTIAIAAHGRTYHFHFDNPAAAKVGDVVEVTYFEGSGGLPHATILSVSKSTAY